MIASDLLRGTPTYHQCTPCVLSNNACYEGHASTKVGQVVVCTCCHVVTPLFLNAPLNTLVRAGFQLVRADHALSSENRNEKTGEAGLQRREMDDSALDITTIGLRHRQFIDVTLTYSQRGNDNPDLIAALSDLTVEPFTGESYGLEHGPEAYKTAVTALGAAGFKALAGDYSRTTKITFLRGTRCEKPLANRGIIAELSWLP